MAVSSVIPSWRTFDSSDSLASVWGVILCTLQISNVKIFKSLLLPVFTQFQEMVDETKIDLQLTAMQLR